MTKLASAHAFLVAVLLLVASMLPQYRGMAAEIESRPSQQGSTNPNVGRLALAQTIPDNRVILVYVESDAAIIAAQLLNARGDVVAADDVTRSSVVWVTIDVSGRAKPLQISPTGALLPAKVDANGKPEMPPGVPPTTEVFAAQVAADGRLVVLLQRLDQGLPRVAVRDDQTLAMIDEVVPPKGLELGGFLSVDNSGNRATGIYRGNAQIRVDSLWGSDHSAATFVSSSITDPDGYAFIDGSYSIPFTGLVERSPDRLTAYASYTRVNYETKAPTQPAVSKFSIRGYSTAINYIQNLSLLESPSGATAASHALIYGIVYDKLWTRDFGFGQDDQSSIVRIPASIRYDFRYFDEPLGLFTVSPGYVRNIPLAAAGDGDDYRKDRAKADPRYDKFILAAGHELDLPGGWSTLMQGFGQYADEALVESESIALGGPGSVRGLESAKTLGEVGAVGQFEVLAPDLLSDIRFAARPSVFVDAGWVEKQGRQPDKPDSETAVGTGVGLRLTGPGGLFANMYAAWLVGGTAVERYVSDDGRLQLYVNAGLNF